MNHYETLGLTKTATADEIKTAYKNLAKKYHPDLNPDNKEHLEKFKLINAAYDILKDTVKKQKYDSVNNDSSSSYWNGKSHNYNPYDESNIDEIFNKFRDMGFDINAAYGHKSYREQTRKNPDLFLSIEITVKEAFTGTTKEISVNYAGKSLVFSVKIPYGIKPGNKIRLKGQAPKQFEGVDAADIFISIQYGDVTSSGHEKFYINYGGFLTTKIQCNFLDLMLGCKKTITNIDGENLEVHFDGLIKTNTLNTPNIQPIIIHGKGMPIFNANKTEPNREVLIVNIELDNSNLSKLSLPELELLRRVQQKIQN